MKRKVEWKKVKNRFVALLSIIVLLGMMCLEVMPALADTTSEEILVTDLKEQGFEYWTLSDVCETDLNIAADTTRNDDTSGYLAEGSLDKTIFTAKITFPKGTNDGRWHIGAATEDKGFLFRTNGCNGTSLRFQHKYKNTTETILDFTADDAKVTSLRDAELAIALSVEYLNERIVNNVEYADLKVGIFINGKLCTNQYYNVPDVPTSELGRRIKFGSEGAYTAKSNYLWDRKYDFEEAELKEQGYDYWTLSDMGVEDGTHTDISSSTKLMRGNQIGTSLDKTIFTAKLNIPDESGDFGRFWIGGVQSEKGFVLRNKDSATDTLRLNLHWPAGTGFAKGDYVLVDTINPKDAGTTLRNNEQLAVSLAVKYTNVWVDETTDVEYANLQIGLYFNGKLYGDSFVDVKSGTELLAVPTSVLCQKAYFTSDNDYAYASNHLWTRELIDTEMKEKGFEFWTLSNVGIDDQKEAAVTHLQGRIDESSLNKTVFMSKINFPANGDFGRFFIGDKDGGSGLHFRGDGNEGLRFDIHYTATGNIAKYGQVIDSMDSATAGVTLRGNENLVVAVSVEYIPDAEGNLTYLVNEVECAKIKVGVFFNGKLYNNQYYTTDTSGKELVVPVLHLRKAFDYDAYEGYPFTALSSTSMMNKVTYRDVSITDGAYANTTAVSATYGTSSADMSGMLFAGEVLYTEGQTGHLYIAGPTEKSGFILTNNEDGTLTLTNTMGVTSLPEIITLTPEKAGTKLVGEAFNLKLTFQYVNANGGNNDLKLGVWFDGVLYNNGYFLYYNCSDAMGNYLGVYTDDDAASVRIASDRSDLPKEVDIYNIEKGAYLLSGETGADVTNLLTKEVKSYEKGATLNVPGYYEISLYKGMYVKTAAIYRIMDAHIDNVIDVKDLVAVIKMKNNVTPVSGANETVTMSADTDGDKDVDATDVKNVRDNLVGSF